MLHVHTKHQSYSPCVHKLRDFQRLHSESLFLAFLTKLYKVKVTGTIRAIIEVGHIRTISIKFGQNPINCLKQIFN